MFTGLSAFPLTPVTARGVDEEGLTKILARLTAAGVDSLGILGSTGSYAYLSREKRKRVATLARQIAGQIPMMVCVGAMSTDAVLHLAEDAQSAGADALLLPAMSYQPLRNEEVYAFYETVTRHVSVPVCVYDNPRTTHFTFTDELHGQLSSLKGIRSVKIPGVSDNPVAAAERVNALRQHLRPGMTIGISGDASAGLGLNAGCEVWYSVCGGLFPETAKQITQAAAVNDHERVTAFTTRLEPLWALFRKHGGSIRVIAAAAGILGLTDPDCLPRPLLPLSKEDIADVAGVIADLDLK
ncbi:MULTISPECIES: dihydrodipicolinate synthase family protein [Pantoea]|jgi:4-hydroxy-tetrahydrodipicolinate synthase|uniref:dihydrodipicolinate synthase family protein n=1 Tax=Pantoea TaxID=53335 RepID=UPI000496F47A|nr:MULTISPECIES: dihydrodipicolinate synthase family protein [Pantoea]AMB75520.1 dihydrodipicolinate synthase family protein [Pantoea ananatis]MDI6535806.1 dihydrodipicolinate synthase family protein [Pantoea ananatis]OWY78134.1 dihydrodipicolinate synthase family protein [Pantoea sp. AMG 501]PQK91378.1 dihydrodipicolinate synthase family protein [Pantoea ananatis]PWV93228.1 4-hydroxy-tetrahydrodipicolinate synthase [Pantoea ananatis]